MRSRWRIGMLLAGLMLLGTGASLDGVRQAREWQYWGDVALANGRVAEANIFYGKVAETFPDSPHGRRAAGLFQKTQADLLTPEPSPASEDCASVKAELIDFLTWP
ncbi:MAG: hypothetical protein HYZ93_03445 [Candidatus Omnitrophica bacterium]|nr:hypothetical protein [Candidatus Omnitrophota bacterium]